MTIEDNMTQRELALLDDGGGMTLSELQQKCRDRKIKAINAGFREGACDVTLFGEDRVAQGRADQLEDAVEVALIRWDGTWK